MSNEDLVSWSSNERIDTWFEHMRSALELLDSAEFNLAVDHLRASGNNSVGSQVNHIAANGHVVRRAVACIDMDRSGFVVPPALFEEARTMRAVCDRNAAQIKSAPQHASTQPHLSQVAEAIATTSQLHVVLPSMELRSLVARSSGATLDKKITNHIEEQFEARSKELSELIAYALQLQQNSTRLAEEVKRSEESIKDSTAAAQHAAKVVDAALGNTAANVHAARHKDLSAKEFGRANDSLYSAAFIGVMLLAGAVINAIFTTPVDRSLTGVVAASEIIRIYGVRVAVLSILLYALSMFVRNYRAHTHNALVHDHRAAVFETFAAFMEAAKDDSAKNLVLTQTLQLVLAQQPTGFLPTEPEPTPAAQAADLLEKISKLKGDKTS